MLDKKSIGERLKNARELKGLKKSQFAEAAGIDASQYGRAERGIEGLGPDKLQNIASRHGINLDYISTGKGEILQNANSLDRNKDDKKEEQPTAMQVFHLLAKTLDSHGRILESIEKKMAQESTQAIINKRTEEIQSSLESLSNGHQSIAIPLGVDREILLRSLARLEGLKDENALLSEADNRIDEREAASVRLGKIHADDKKNTEVPE